MKPFSEDVLFLQRVTFTTLPDTPTSTLRNSVTPSVQNANSFICSGATVTITNFLNGADGQVIHLLGDGTTTIQYNAKIVTSTLANKILADNVIYQFHLIDDVWYELNTQGGVTATAEYSSAWFPSAATVNRVALGNITNFNALTKCTIMVWFTFGQTGTFAALFSRYGNPTAFGLDTQISIGQHSNNRPLWRCYNTATANDLAATGSTTLAISGRYKLTVVYDGTQGTDATRCVMYLSQRNDTTLVYPSDAAETIAFTGTVVPTSLSTPGITVDAKIGGLDSNFHTFQGTINEVRVWFGTALSATQVRAETLLANSVAAGLRYKIEGNFNNTGSVSGFNGTPHPAILPAYA